MLHGSELVGESVGGISIGFHSEIVFHSRFDIRSVDGDIFISIDARLNVESSEGV